METLRQDLRYALRRLSAAPMFTAIAVLTLAIGIGANAAIFTVVNAVVLQPLPYAESDRLVGVFHQGQGGELAVMSPPNFLDVRRLNRSLEDMAAIDESGFTLTGAGDPIRLEGASVSAGFFDVLRVRPILGRPFRADENESGKHKVVVLSHGLWVRRFGGDSGVIGRSVSIDGTPFTVVGVMPAGFSYPEARDLWVPLEYDEVFRVSNRGAWYLQVIGRLKPGVSATAASADVAAIAAQLAKQFPRSNTDLSMSVAPLHGWIVDRSRTALLLLLGAVGIRAAHRLRERRQPHAGARGDAGGRAGGARGARRQARPAGAATADRKRRGGAGWRRHGPAGGGLGQRRAGAPRTRRRAAAGRGHGQPAGRGVHGAGEHADGAARRQPSGLANHARRAGWRLARGRARRTDGTTRHASAHGLVVAEMALAVVLLAGAGLLVNSFIRLQHVNPGFQVGDALTFRLALPEAAYDTQARRIEFYDRALAAIAGPARRAHGGRRHGPAAERPALQHLVRHRRASTGTARTGAVDGSARGHAGLLQGPRHSADARPPLHRRGPVREPAGRAAQRSGRAQYFPGENPLGRRIVLGWNNDERAAGGEVVGVVGDVKDLGLDEPAPAEIYLPHAQMGVGQMTIVLRSDVPPASLAAPVTRTIHGLDPNLPISSLRSLDEIVARSVSQPRFYMLLLGTFALAALLLAAIGIFGVMSYAVTQQTREFGIRIALGADRRAIVRMVLTRAMLLITLGLGLGVAGALVVGRAMSTLLFDVSPQDPLTLLAVVAVLAGVAFLASYLPARRATRVDPMVA